MLKLIKFRIVGFSGIIVDYGITILYKESTGINRYLANSPGFTVAASSNYQLNRLWTFRSQNPESPVNTRSSLCTRGHDHQQRNHLVPQ